MKEKLCSLGENCKANSSKHFKEFHHESTLEKELIAILIKHCGERGDNEGAVETLERIIGERDLLLRRAIERDIFHKDVLKLLHT